MFFNNLKLFHFLLLDFNAFVVCHGKNLILVLFIFKKFIFVKGHEETLDLIRPPSPALTGSSKISRTSTSQPIKSSFLFYTAILRPHTFAFWNVSTTLPTRSNLEIPKQSSSSAISAKTTTRSPLSCIVPPRQSSLSCAHRHTQKITTNRPLKSLDLKRTSPEKVPKIPSSTKDAASANLYFFPYFQRPLEQYPVRCFLLVRNPPLFKIPCPCSTG